ncbi:hypothetical protein [Kribbella sp. VKM Ac-2569]|uniref:hypothetical protein n=1 Tax=Kribbella sp. VKM Ac-2569 TaxID=2512220 RepID=UPI00102B4375|nr:hypothetical protein [Kribbella sp. VKM Ac-2569]
MGWQWVVIVLMAAIGLSMYAYGAYLLAREEARSGRVGRGSRRVGAPRCLAARALGATVRWLRSIQIATAAAAIRPAMPA